MLLGQPAIDGQGFGIGVARRIALPQIAEHTAQRAETRRQILLRIRGAQGVYRLLGAVLEQNELARELTERDQVYKE